jgi:hypothetical protein
MGAVHANLILALAQAALVTVAPGPEDNCPSSAQVQVALEMHAPRLVASRPDDDPASQLSLNLSFASPGREMSLSLLDSKGQVRLYRTLPPPPGDRARDCAALADTVAFIVDRYFQEVELPSLPERRQVPEPPPPPPQPPSPPEPPASKAKLPRFTLSANAGRRMPGGAVDLGGVEFKLTLDAALASLGKRGGRMWGEFSGGLVGIAADRGWNYGDGAATGNATAVRTGADLAVLLGWPAWHGQLYAGPLLSVELVWLDWLDASSNGRLHREISIGSAAGLRVGYQHFWNKHFFARADLNGCIAIRRQKVVTQSAPPDAVLFSAPAAYMTLSLGVGIWF